MGINPKKAVRPVLELVREGPAVERAIIDGLARSDPAAGRALYDEYGDLVNKLVWSLLGADQDHDDVVHQVFVNILSSIGGVKNPAALRSWITGVTLNTVRREIRSRRYRRILRLVPETPEQSRAEDRRSPLVRHLYAVLDRMGAEERIAFTLHHVEGQSLPEAAAVMGCSLATTKRRIAKARSMLMKEMVKNAHLASVIEELKHEE